LLRTRVFTEELRLVGVPSGTSLPKLVTPILVADRSNPQ
jgi:hypothetical protein